MGRWFAVRVVPRVTTIAGVPRAPNPPKITYQAPEVVELVQLVLLLHVDVPPKQVHAAADGGGGVEGPGRGPHRRLVGCKPRVLVALQHRQVVQRFFALVDAAKHDLCV